MSSSGDQSTGAFCVCYKYKSSKSRIFINYESHPREDKSIKIPGPLIEAFLASEQTSGQQEEATKSIKQVDEQSIRPQVEVSFKACYGTCEPQICTSENGKDLVIPVKIFEGDWQVLNKIPFKQPKRALLSVIFNIIQESHLQVLDGTVARIKLSPFRLELVGKPKPSGERATKEKICSILLESKVSIGQELPWGHKTAMKVGDFLMGICAPDPLLGRTVHYRFIACDKTGSIKLPLCFMGPARSFSQLHFLIFVSDLQRVILRALAHVIHDCLTRLYRYRGPVVYMPKNSKDIWIDVPVHLDHAAILMRYCLDDDLESGFFNLIMAFYDVAYLHQAAPMMRVLDRTRPPGDCVFQLPSLT